MKLLVIDVGNTSTAVGLWTDGRVSHVVHVDGDARFDPPRLMALVSPAAVRAASGVVYVSVVPRADRAFLAHFRKAGTPFHRLSHADMPLKLDYPHPETIGADRLADATGAVSKYGAPVLVMDFGTALTAAIVTSDRVWRGGVIAPGFPLMRDYLFERTAKLPRMELGRGRAPKIGRSTEEAMRFGALVGYRGMVREIVSTLSRNFDESFRLVATGGFARWALCDLDLPFVVDPTLTLYGAGLIGARALNVRVTAGKEKRK